MKDGVSNVIVTRNKISGNDGGGTGRGRGIGIDGSWSNIDFNHNFIKDNSGGGIKIMGTGTGFFRCNYNCIPGNVGYGAENTLATLLDFENNYWGDRSIRHSTGPYHPTTNPAGQGDRVSNNVDYDPWLTSCPLALVGGEWLPIAKVHLLFPLIGSAISMVLVTIGFVFANHKR